MNDVDSSRLKSHPPEKMCECSIPIAHPRVIRHHHSSANAEIGNRAVVCAGSEILVRNLERSRAKPLKKFVLPDIAARENNIEAFLRFVVQVDDLFREVLEIAIHHHDPPPCREFQAGGDGTDLTEVP